MKIKSSSNFMWECECGHIEYDESAVEECKKCSRLESFMKVPKSIVEEMEEDMAEEIMVKPGKGRKAR